MKPLLTRSNSTPHSSSFPTPSSLKRSFRAGPVSPYHLLHYHSFANSKHDTGAEYSTGNRRGSVPGGEIGTSQSSSRKGLVVQQDDGVKRAADPELKKRADTRKPLLSDLAAITKHRIAMEEISSAIQRIANSAGDQINHLATTYDIAVTKLEEIQAMTVRFAELHKLTAELVDSFSVSEERFQMDMKCQIKGLGAYKEEMAAIQALQARLDLQRRTVEVYKARLEKAEDKISRQKELEIIWRQRASRRLRILWGIISVLVIVWLLATSTHDSLLGVEDVDDVEDRAPNEQFINDNPLNGFFDYGSLPKEVISAEADRLLRQRHQNT